MYVTFRNYMRHFLLNSGRANIQDMKYLLEKDDMKIFFLVLFSFCICAHVDIDLEEHPQEFVLETKQILIPGYPGAFNASVIRWQEKLLLCFRARDEKGMSTFQMGFVWLDDEFNPVSRPTLLEIYRDPSTFSQNQDPRLIVIDEKLYILYSNFITIEDIGPRRMFIAQVQNAGERFFIDSPLCLHPFEGWSKRWEKNWAPFIHDGELFLAYSIVPHRIFKPSLQSGTCQTVSSPLSAIDWQWGELRGGTPALLIGDEYISFFHSSKAMATQQSGGKNIQHYFMGAYTFSAQPPFQITRMSAEPIVGKNFYNGPSYTTWKPLRVVFPMGCVMDENFIWVTYGRQDFEIWVAKFDKQALLDSLIPCPVTAMYADFVTSYAPHAPAKQPIRVEIDVEAEAQS